MKRILCIVFLFISVVASAQLKNLVSQRPNPPRLVNDYTNTLTTEQKDALERKLIAYDDSTSNQVAIVMVPTLEGLGLEDAALEIMRKWGVGSKKNNNGVVILIAKDDRQVTLQTGYGLEGVIPDVTAKMIIDNSITPNFKNGNFYRGLDEATDDIFRAAAGRYTAPEGYNKGKKSGRGIGLGVMIAIIILISLFSGRGGGGGGMISRRGAGDFGSGWLLGTLLGSLGSGGRGGGGGSWGGGGGGGGFGGFGGGSGGGGGASGSW